MPAGGGGGSSGAIRAGRAFVEISTKNSGLLAGLNSAKAMMTGFGRFMGRAGAGLVAGGTATLGAVGALVAGAVSKNTAVLDLADKLGTSTEKLSAFEYALSSTGITLDDLEGHFENFAERVFQAANGAGEAADSFRKLGLNPQALKQMDAVDQMVTTLEALKKVNPADRLGLESSLGGDQFQKLNVAVNRVKDLRGEMAKAADVGALVDQDTARLAKRFQTAWSTGFTVVKNTLLSLGEAFFPSVSGFESLVNKVKEWGKQARTWVADNQGTIQSVALIAAAVIALGTAFIGTGLALTTAATAFGGFVSLFGAVSGAASFITSALLMPIVAIPAAIAAAGVAFLVFTEDGRALLGELGDAVVDMFSDTTANITASWKAIVGAIGRGDFEMAFKIGVGAIKTEWARGIVWLTDYWNRFKGIFLDGWTSVVQKFADIWTAGIDSTANALVWLGERAGIYSKQEADDIRATMAEDARLEAAARTRERIAKATAAQEARSADLDAAKRDLKVAEDEQKKLLEENAELQRRADEAEKAKKENDRGKRDGGPMTAAVSAIRGAFAGSGSLGQVFSQGKSYENRLADLAQRQLQTLKDLNESTIDVRKAIEKKRGLFFGSELA